MVTSLLLRFLTVDDLNTLALGGIALNNAIYNEKLWLWDRSKQLK